MWHNSNGTTPYKVMSEGTHTPTTDTFRHIQCILSVFCSHLLLRYPNVLHTVYTPFSVLTTSLIRAFLPSAPVKITVGLLWEVCTYIKSFANLKFSDTALWTRGLPTIWRDPPRATTSRTFPFARVQSTPSVGAPLRFYAPATYSARAV